VDKSFINFAIHMGESSITLIENNHYHSGVYLGGYALEGYLKDVLINKMDYKLEEIKIHLNTKSNEKLKKYEEVLLHKEVECFLNNYPEKIIDSLLLKSNKKYPKFLINGGSNKAEENKWDVNKRYEIQQWSEKEYAIKIKKEVENILEEIIDKYLTEGGQ